MLSFVRRFNCSDFVAVHSRLWENSVTPYTDGTWDRYYQYASQLLSDKCGVAQPVSVDSSFESYDKILTSSMSIVYRAHEYVTSSIRLLQALKKAMLYYALVGKDFIIDSDDTINKLAVKSALLSNSGTLQVSTTHDLDAKTYRRAARRYRNQFNLANREVINQTLAALSKEIKQLVAYIICTGQYLEPNKDPQAIITRLATKSSNVTWTEDNEYALREANIRILVMLDESMLVEKYFHIKPLIEDPNELPQTSKLLENVTAQMKADPRFMAKVLEESLKPEYLNPAMAFANTVNAIQVLSDAALHNVDETLNIRNARAKIMGYAGKHPSRLTTKHKVVFAPVYVGTEFSR
jgi:hypothetical protein